MDEWWLAHWFRAVQIRKATVADLLALNNEHRIVFPKLLWTPLAFLTHWNLRVEMMLHVFLALIIFAAFYRLSLTQAELGANASLHLANFSTSLLIFSLIQYGTWLWGIGGAFVLVQAAVALAICGCTSERLSPVIRFSLAAFFCFVASFSSAHGLLSWLALLPCIAFVPMGKRPARKFCLWSILFALSAAVYFYHFKFPGFTGKASPFGLLDHPLQRGKFFLALLGAPFCQSDATIPLSIALALGSTKHLVLLGAAVLLGLLACLLVLRRDQQLAKATPWLSVGLFGLFFVITVTAGRGDSGLLAAMQSRYITGSIFVPIAAIQLGRLVCSRKLLPIYLFVVSTLCLLVMLGSMNAVAVARRLNKDLSDAKLFVELIRYMDPVADGLPEGRFFSLSHVSIRPQAELLNEIGFLRLASDVSFVEHPCENCGAFESANGSSSLLHLRQGEDEITVSGWAVPGNRRSPTMVLISYGDRKTFITGTVVGGVNRPDIAALRQDPAFIRSGWTVSFPATFLPLGEGSLKAWVYASAQKRFVRLSETGGEKKLRVEPK